MCIYTQHPINIFCWAVVVSSALSLLCGFGKTVLRYIPTERCRHCVQIGKINEFFLLCENDQLIIFSYNTTGRNHNLYIAIGKYNLYLTYCKESTLQDGLFCFMSKIVVFPPVIMTLKQCKNLQFTLSKTTTNFFYYCARCFDQHKPLKWWGCVYVETKITWNASSAIAFNLLPRKFRRRSWSKFMNARRSKCSIRLSSSSNCWRAWHHTFKTKKNGKMWEIVKLMQ